MKSISSFLSWPGVLGAWSTSVVEAADTMPTPILPLKPAELIAYLPPAPDKWTMTASFGASDFVGGWITSFAERDFKQIVPPPLPGAPAPPEPATMKIHLTDTGYKSNFAPVVTPAKDTPSANTTFFKINDFPARSIELDATTTILNFLVKNRFLIEIRATNLTADQVKQFAEGLDCTRLLVVPDTGETRISDPVILNRFDEMNPQKTRSYPLFWQPVKP